MDWDGTTCEFLGRRPRGGAERKPAIEQPGQSVHIVPVGTSSRVPEARRGKM
jgi:hypothetical protein